MTEQSLKHVVNPCGLRRCGLGGLHRAVTSEFTVGSRLRRVIVSLLSLLMILATTAPAAASFVRRILGEKDGHAGFNVMR